MLRSGRQEEEEEAGARKKMDQSKVGSKGKEELVCLYSFTKSSNTTRRKIKQQYDQLVKSHGSKGCTKQSCCFCAASSLSRSTSLFCAFRAICFVSEVEGRKVTLYLLFTFT